MVFMVFFKFRLKKMVQVFSNSFNTDTPSGLDTFYAHIVITQRADTKLSKALL